MPQVTLATGQAVHYVDHGGDGPAVVLLHSFLMDASMFGPQVAALGDAFRLVAVDERGHGGTPGEPGFDYWDVARDVLGVLDELGVAQAAVVGTSQGGFVALRLALLAPDRVTAVAVLGSSAAEQAPEIAEAYRQLGAAWAANGPVDQVIGTVSAICLGGKGDASAWEARWREVPAATVTSNIETLVSRESLLDRLHEITCPVLVLHGSADAAYPVEHAQDVVDRVPRAEPLVVVDGGAHFLSLTDPDAVNPALHRFLTDHAGG